MKNKFLLAFLVISSFAGVQAQKTEPAFEVVSIRHSDIESHMSRMPNGDTRMSWKPVEFNGTRLSGDAPLGAYIQFACSDLLTPFREEHPAATAAMGGPGMPSADYYQIEAVAPEGTTLDEARVMLRKALTERLGFQFHLADRETPTYNLVRGSGALKLTPATDLTPGMELHKTNWDLHVKAYTLQSFANFVSGTAGRPVIDKTGIEGKFKFDLDWNAEVQQSMASGFRGAIDPIIAIDGVKAFGLKLEPGTETRKILVVDHINKEPTPN